MSKNNNVNPGQYKVAGRERQGEDVVPQIEKAKLAKARDARGAAASERSQSSRREREPSGAASSAKAMTTKQKGSSKKTR